MNEAKVVQVWRHKRTKREAVVVWMDGVDVRYRYVDGKREVWKGRRDWLKQFELTEVLR